MSNGNQSFRPEIYSEDSRSYQAVSAEYAQYWKQHNPDLGYYEWVQTQLLDHYRERLEQACSATDGALLVCGPGFDISNLDWNPSIRKAFIAKHPFVVGMDWSEDVLRNFYVSASEERELGAKLRLVRRDFSSGLSAKLHSRIVPELEQIGNVHELREFIAKIKDTSIEDVRQHKLSVNQIAGEFRTDIQQILSQPNPFDLQSMFKQAGMSSVQVRLITANMLLAGMFALTEGEVRDCIHRFKDDLDEQELGEMLREWHRLIKELNTYVAADFIIKGLECHPDAHILAPTDVDVAYVGIDTFDRVDLEKLRDILQLSHVRLRLTTSRIQDDSNEPPFSHEHTIRGVVASKNGFKKEGEQASSGKVYQNLPLVPGNPHDTSSQSSETSSSR